MFRFAPHSSALSICAEKFDARLTDSKGRPIFPGDILINDRGWEMRIIEVDLFLCTVERVGMKFRVFRESLQDGNWVKQ